MLKVQIKNQQNVITNEGTFQNQTAVDNWLTINGPHFPAGYNSVVTNVDDEILENQKTNERNSVRESTLAIIDLIAAKNLEYVNSATLAAFLANADIQKLIMCLLTGIPSLAAALVVQNQALFEQTYPPEVVQDILARLQSLITEV